LVDPYDQYDLNYYLGNTLELDICDEWGVEGFDAVIGNPPYQATNSIGTGTPIWNLFVKISINAWLKEEGYLCFVHPSGWRKRTDKGHFKNLYEIMTSFNYIIYLEIHNSKDGIKTFNCGTRYDWYILKKTSTVNNTIIKNELGIIEKINLKNTLFCPNYSIEYILKNLLSYDKNNLIVNRNCNYHSTTMAKKGILNDTETNIFKYKVIHSITQKGIKYKFSSNNTKDSFNISKILLSDNMNLNIIIDDKGLLGTTEHILFIIIKNKNEAINIKKAFESEKFKNIIAAFILSNFQIDYKILSLLKKDFWKEFI